MKRHGRNIERWRRGGSFQLGSARFKLGTGKHQVPIENMKKNLREAQKAMKGTG